MQYYSKPTMSPEFVIEADPAELIFKVLVVGDVGTGKTSIIKKYVHGIFNANYKSTIGVDFAMKNITYPPHSVKLMIWDIAGQERFSNMTRIYYKDSHAVIMVFDVLRPYTFDSLTHWLEDVRIKLGDDIPVYIFGNKWDSELFNIDQNQIIKFCEDNKIAGYFMTSARNNIGIEDGMKALTDLLVSNEFSGKNSLKSAKKNDFDQNINISDNRNTASFSCC